MMGSFGEFIQPPINQVALKPKSLTHVEAAALPLVGVTCVQAFAEHGLEAGQRVLVIGASGGVGHIACQYAVLKGADVVGVCSGRNKKFVEGCGVSTVLDYGAEGDIIEKIHGEAAENGKFHIILDCVSSADTRDSKVGYREKILELRDQILINPDVHNYVVLGGTPIEWTKAAIKRFTNLNFFSKSFELFWIKMPNSSPALYELKELAEREDGRNLRPKISQELDWSEENIRVAFDALRSRRATGKIVLKM